MLLQLAPGIGPSPSPPRPRPWRTASAFGASAAAAALEANFERNDPRDLDQGKQNFETKFDWVGLKRNSRRSQTHIAAARHERKEVGMSERGENS